MWTEKLFSKIVLTTFVFSFYLLTACQQGGLGPSGTVPLGSALDGGGVWGPQGATGEGNSLDQDTVEEEENATGDSGFVAILNNSPTLDVGEVAPLPDVGLDPLLSTGTGKLICRYGGDKVLFEMEGRLRQNLHDDDIDEPVDIDPGETGLTLRLVDKTNNTYQEFFVEPVDAGDCNEPSQCIHNHFVARFVTNYPFPTDENDHPLLKFYLSDSEYQAPSYNTVETCPEARDHNDKIFVSTHPVYQSGVDPYCHPANWGLVWTQFHFWNNPPEEENIPSCLSGNLLNKAQKAPISSLPQ